MTRFADYQAGDSGQGVRDLQTNLQKLGYPIKVDGSFGGATTAAVTHFQEQVGPDDMFGVAGPATLIAMAEGIASGWKQKGFYYVPGVTIGPIGTNLTPPSDTPQYVDTPGGGFDRKQLALIGAAGIGVAWFFYSRR